MGLLAELLVAALLIMGMRGEGREEGRMGGGSDVRRSVQDSMIYISTKVPEIEANQAHTFPVHVGGLIDGFQYRMLLIVSQGGEFVHAEERMIENVSEVHPTLPPLQPSMNEYAVSISILDPSLDRDKEEALLARLIRHIKVSNKESSVKASRRDWDCQTVLETYDAASDTRCESRAAAAAKVAAATVGTVDRAVVIYNLAHRWRGPLSVVFYTSTEEEREIVRTFVREELIRASKSYCKSLWVQLVSDCKDKNQPDDQFSFPVNKLRFEAINVLPHDYVLYVDADFLPSDNALVEIERGLKEFDELESALLVIPCFMSDADASWPRPVESRRGEGGRGGRGGEESEDETWEVPSIDLSTLKLHMKGRKVRPPGAPFNILSHGATDYARWLRVNGTGRAYEVSYNMWYEPYVVVNRRLWGGMNGGGLFDDRFAFAFADKVQLTYEAAVMGYRFFVLPSVFLIHVPQAAGFRCLPSSPELCALSSKDVGWRAENVGFQASFDLIHFILDLPVWESRPSKPRSRPCFLPPYRILRDLSTKELLSILIPDYSTRSKGWSCCFNVCEHLPVKLLHFAHAFLEQNLLDPDDAATALQHSEALRVGMRKWCADVTPLSGYLVNTRQAQIALERLVLEGGQGEAGAFTHYLEEEGVVTMLKPVREEGEFLLLHADNLPSCDLVGPVYRCLITTVDNSTGMNGFGYRMETHLYEKYSGRTYFSNVSQLKFVGEEEEELAYEFSYQVPRLAGGDFTLTCRLLDEYPDLAPGEELVGARTLALFVDASSSDCQQNTAGADQEVDNSRKQPVEEKVEEKVEEVEQQETREHVCASSEWCVDVVTSPTIAKSIARLRRLTRDPLPLPLRSISMPEIEDFLAARDETVAEARGARQFTDPPSMHVEDNYIPSYEESLYKFWSMLRQGTPFALLRFGDGELALLNGESYQSRIDVVQWSSLSSDRERERMKLLLADAFALAQGCSAAPVLNSSCVYLGLPVYFCAEGTETYLKGGGGRWEWLESYYKQPAIASYLERTHMRFLTQSWLWGNLNYQTTLDMLEDVGRYRRIILVCNEEIRGRSSFDDLPSWISTILTVPGEGLRWFSANFDQVVDQAAWLASSVNDCVFAFAAGPISNLLIPVMWRANQHNTYVDFGGTLDLVVLGRSTRDFHPDTSEGEKTWVKAGGALQPDYDAGKEVVRKVTPEWLESIFNVVKIVV
ncbi:hypothetical protein GUITHDRAFT_163273 [Guillardia theta CCMP2712]|uniref:Uncharacterized protein n=2 Tax=Guillardia theta TaxID=55529 RepID=L1JBA9_GUITC|nr:hypothetical protein GUITHDRAFT_163273 [Guillardia theta CCMP2712]EKX45404.1 hypothetical protein GUITHDRAFT_163273 [Guillardia theta CCMP2712]|eukprot:XP_005832384.1 hypothetical protein GUITHDRAFT_163273 [Guillardia theta CCMP2712]